MDVREGGLRAKNNAIHRSEISLSSPYLTINITEPEYFDDIIYPEGFEKYHFKAAIPARNRYLVDNAAYALCYVTHDWGGAAQTLERAQKKGLTIINLGERNDGRNNL